LHHFRDLKVGWENFILSHSKINEYDLYAQGIDSLVVTDKKKIQDKDSHCSILYTLLLSETCLSNAIL
jgi:hypothetical protein